MYKKFKTKELSMLKKSLALLLITICLPYSTIQAAKPSESPSSHSPCNDQCQPCRITARHIENKGIGYNTGYTTLEAFLAAPTDLWPVMPFVDLRGHILGIRLQMVALAFAHC
jgi:hypothetical protein